MSFTSQLLLTWVSVRIAVDKKAEVTLEISMHDMERTCGQSVRVTVGDPHESLDGT